MLAVAWVTNCDVSGNTCIHIEDTPIFNVKNDYPRHIHTLQIFWMSVRKEDGRGITEGEVPECTSQSFFDMLTLLLDRVKCWHFWTLEPFGCRLNLCSSACWFDVEDTPIAPLNFGLRLSGHDGKNKNNGLT